VETKKSGAAQITCKRLEPSAQFTSTVTVRQARETWSGKWWKACEEQGELPLELPTSLLD